MFSSHSIPSPDKRPLLQKSVQIADVNKKPQFSTYPTQDWQSRSLTSNKDLGLVCFAENTRIADLHLQAISCSFFMDPFIKWATARQEMSSNRELLQNSFNSNPIRQLPSVRCRGLVVAVECYFGWYGINVKMPGDDENWGLRTTPTTLMITMTSGTAGDNEILLPKSTSASLGLNYIVKSFKFSTRKHFWANEIKAKGEVVHFQF